MSEQLTMIVVWTCHKCWCQLVKTIVPTRSEGEPIEDYMRKVGQKCGDHHVRLSPRCPCRHIDLAIPLSQNDEDPLGFSGSLGEVGPDSELAKQMKSKGLN